MNAYDEITRNNLELSAKLARLKQVLTCELFLEEIEKFNKTVYVPAATCANLSSSVDEFRAQIKNYDVNVATITMGLSNGSTLLLGFVLGPDVRIIQQTIKLYVTGMNERQGKTLH